MERTDADRAFARFRTHGDPADLAKVFDLLAPQLLLVAHHLSRSGVSAEDLVQDTFVRSIETVTRFDPSRKVLPWLLGILSGEAQNARRKAARVPDPRRIPLADAPIPADIAAAEEFRVQLVAALDSLSGSYRDVMNLRLVHGLTPTEIAHALGRSPDTVKTQLRRGRDLLKLALPASFASVLALVLAPSSSLTAMRAQILEVARQSAVPITADSPPAIEAILAKSTRQLFRAQSILAASLLIGGTAALLWALNPWGNDAPPATDYLRTELVAQDEGAATRSSGAIRYAKKTPQAHLRPRAYFRGRLVTPAGGPVPDEEVSLFRFAPDVLEITPEQYFPGSPTPRRVLAGRTRTDPLGFFEIAGVWPESFFVVAWQRQVRVVAKTPTPDHPVELGQLVVEPTSSLAGRIVDSSGRAAVGARVRVTRLSSGFLLNYPVHDLLDAAHVVYAPGSDALDEVGAFWRTLLNLPVNPAATAVFVRPAYLDQVAVLWPFHETRTDADGRFEIDAVPIGAVSLVISFPNHETLVRGDIQVDRVITRELGSCALKAGRTASGRIFDLHGSPLAGAEVCFAPQGANGSPFHFGQQSVLTDKNGEYTLGGISRNRGHLAVRAHTGDRWFVRPLATTQEYLTTRLPAGHTLNFTFLSQLGKAIPAADVALIPGTSSLGLAHRGLVQPLDLTDRLSTEEDASCRIENIPQGDYLLIVRSSGHQTHAAELRVNRNLRDVIHLEPLARYDITVLGATHEPVAGAEVYARSLKPLGPLAAISLHCGTTDAAGHVMIEGVAGTEIAITALHAEHGIGQIFRLATPDSDWQVVLSVPGQIGGKLVDVEPEQLEKWSVLMRPRDQDRYALASAPALTPAGSPTDFRHGRLAEAVYAVQAIAALDNLVTTAQLTERLLRLEPTTPIILADATTSPRIELLTQTAAKPEPEESDPVARVDHPLTGIVHRHDGKPAEDAQLRLLARDATTKPLPATTNFRGEFRFDAIAPGDYVLVIRAPGPLRKIISLTVDDEAHKPLAIAMESGYFVSGKVLKHGSLKAIQFVHQDRFGNWLNFEPKRISLTADGRFEAPVVLPAGTYLVTPAGATVQQAYFYLNKLQVLDRDLEGIAIKPLLRVRRPPPGVIIRRPGRRR